MLIRWVKLENIRSYTSQKIELPIGSTLLSGDIGSGKSSILFAIEFALFGTKRKELSANSLLRTGTKQGNVELCLELDKKELIIKRILKRGKDAIKQEAGYLIINGIKKDLTAVELRTHILDMLGYPKELVAKSKDLIFRYTVYTPQEEMKAILLEDKEIRLDTLRRVFGIDKYKRIKENSGIYTKHIRENMRELEGRTADLGEKEKQKKQQEEEIKKVLEKIKKVLPEIEAIKNKIMNENKNFENIEKKLKDYQEKAKKLEVKKETLNQKQRQTIELKQNMKTVEKEIEETRKNIEKIKSEKSDIDEALLESEILEKEKTLNETESRLALLNEKQKNNETKIVELTKEIEHKSELTKKMIEHRSYLQKLDEKVKNRGMIEKKISEAEEMLSHLLEGLKENEIIIRNSENTLDKLKKIDKCPTCLQDVDEEHKHRISSEEQEKIGARKQSLEHIKEKQNSFEEELKRLKEKLDDAQKSEKDSAVMRTEIREMEKTSKDIVEKQKQYSGLVEQTKTISEQIDELKKLDLDAIKKDVEKKRKLLKEAREQNKLLMEKNSLSKLLDEKNRNIELMIRQIENNNNELEQIQKELKENEDELKEYDNIEKEHSDLKLAIEKLKNEEKILEIRKAEHEKEKEAIEKTLTLLDEEIKEKKKQKERIKELSSLEHWLSEHFTNLMAVMERQVMLKLYYEFNELFQSWFSLLIEDRLTVRLNEEFTPIIEQNGYELEVENLSGGEKTALALAYRLSLNRVINDFITDIKTRDIIILDEPTDGFSSEQLDRVRDVLDQLKVKQVIIVSHENKVESFVDNVIRISKEEHESKVVSI